MNTEQKKGFEPTPGQAKAIDHRDHDILVAASAGSGKTKVLIERVIKQVVESHVDLSRMLIVTFTDAAAKEMRERLTKQLQKNLMQQQAQASDSRSNELISWLRQQLVAVNVADISTLHAFCLHLIQKYYYIVDIEPDFRLISDDTERTLIRDDVWQKVRERFYQQLEDAEQADNRMSEQEKENAQLFGKLLQVFAKDRDDEPFSDVVMRADEFASATSEPERWLNNLSQTYTVDAEADFTQSKIWQEMIQTMVLQSLTSIIDLVKKRNELYSSQLLPTMEDYWEHEVDPELRDYAKKKQKRLEKYAEKGQHQLRELETLQEFKAAILESRPYDELRALAQDCRLSAKPALMKYKSPTSPNDLNEQAVGLNDQMKQLHASANKQFDQLLLDYFALSGEEILALMLGSEKLLVKFGEIVLAFRAAYQKEKKRRHLLDFNDLEHYALAIVSSPTEESQRIKAMLQERYYEIMVDEYQDTNGVQEALLTQIKNPETGNLFMVGDVKQSIYRFRQADPALFNHKYHIFSESTSGELSADKPGEKIILAENFRSVHNVADLTNLIFKQLMDEKVGEISYDSNAELKAANQQYPPTTQHVEAELLVYESGEAQNDNEDTEQAPAAETFEIDSKEQGQIYLVATKIKKLFAQHLQIFDRDKGEMRDLEYRDIAILASTHGDSLLIAEEFKNLGLPVQVDNTNNYFKTIEVQIMMSLLQVIDNPHQDIPLVAVLRSPLYQFDENDLAYLRIQLKHGDFYQTLTDYRYQYEQGEREADQNEQGEALYQKVVRFLDDLTSFRVRGRRNDLSTLIWAIYSRTGFLDFAGGMPGGKQRQANLHALYERAADYEKMSYKGIFQFVRFIKKMQEKEHDLAEMSIQDGGNAISFMTIHKSKGLEFPVVFLINAHKRFNLRAISAEPYVLDNQLGMGIDYVKTLTEDERQVQVKFQTPVKTVIKERATQKAIAEEMRKLYVALTRAEQKIFIVGESKDAESALNCWLKAIEPENLTLADAERQRHGANYLDWIGAALLRSREFSADNVARYTLDQTGAPSTENGVKILEDQEQRVALEENIQALQANAPAEIKNSPAQFRVEFWDQNRVRYDLGQNEAESHESAQEWLKRQSQSGQLPPMFAQKLNFKYPEEQLTLTAAYQSVTDIKRLFEDPDNETMGVANLEQSAGQFEEQPAQYLQHGFKRPLFMTEENNVTPAQIGTATHLVFQKLDLSQTVTIKGVTQLIGQLCEQELLTTPLAKKINVPGIVGLFKTPLGQAIIAHQETLEREAPIAMLYPAEKLFAKTRQLEPNPPVLIHGIVDGYFTDQAGNTFLFDYKTDHVPATGTAQQAADKYRGQLNLYSLALQSIIGEDTKIRKFIYLVEKSEVIEL
ncbi:ATP-dependent helicase/nuclease subunit A [Ligilactobacillus salitolerans]|uniref:ATP-dependent helicase/nuclease subunit A n=1 Tax=Ligilactobacillus salitolerans TaxID=1808352 RepID=A0A401IRH9_9LACO|nr:helicase-exonuclease AddAB subunit AddA [Ligilactobacillus salitolerans]GBG94104.1 ATP-dependent helicase/nuclease subunit A [Ligilactobacillus salitolerans]